MKSLSAAVYGALAAILVGVALAQPVNPPSGGNGTGPFTPVGKTGISNTSVTVKATAGTLGMVVCDNNNAAWSYLQLFDVTTPSVGTNVGFIPIPPATTNGYALPVQPLVFNNSIKVAATTAPGGSTAPGTALNCTFGFN